ncbi:MAG: ClpX C4-type zinc finger protein [Acidobacteriota bacterium]
MKTKKLYCSFCRKDSTDVSHMLGGPGVNICGECVTRCNDILASSETLAFDWTELSDEALLRAMASSSAMVDQARETLQRHVDLLRERGISWAAIGEELGVSRQAAWERFT